MQKFILPPAFTYKQAIESGMSRRKLEKKLSEGVFLKIGHGLYFNTEANIPEESVNFYIACRKFGEESYIGGLTALFYYGLIDAPPQKVWVVVPEMKRTVDKKYHLIRTKKQYSWGLHKTEHFTISDINRTLVDAFRYASKIGLRTAVSATVRAVSENKTSITEILKMSEKLECGNMLKRYMDMIIGAVEG